MDVKFILMAERIERNEAQQFSIINTIDYAEAPFFPIAVNGIWLVAMLEAGIHECEIEHVVVARLVDAEGQIVFEASTTVKPKEIPGRTRGNWPFYFEIQSMVLPNPGMYTWQVLTDGELHPYECHFYFQLGQ